MARKSLKAEDFEHHKLAKAKMNQSRDLSSKAFSELTAEEKDALLKMIAESMGFIKSE